MVDNKVVGMAIAKLRQADGMTQQTLAACLNVSHQAVSKWEKGATLPDVLTLVELSRMFGVTMEQLLSGDVDFRLEGKEAAAEKPIELKLDYTDINAKAEKAIEDAEFAVEENTEADTSEADPETEAAQEAPKADEKIDLDKIIEMAPFMSRAALDEIVLKYNGKCTPKQLSRLAPFLSKDCLEKLVVNCESDISWDTLRRLAPFLRKEFVDAFASAAAKGEKYTNDLGKQIKHGIKKVYNIGDQIYHDSIKPALKKVMDPEKLCRAAKQAAPAPAPTPVVNRVATARNRLFERALSEDKFDWIGEHIDQLDDEALKARIAARAMELGMNEWLDNFMADYCNQDAMDNAILSGNWDYVSAHIEDADEDALAIIADTAAAEGKWDWIAQNLECIAECDDARAAVIDHALKTDNLEWIGEHISELNVSEIDSELIASKAIQNGSWEWLEAHMDDLEGEWADSEYALNAYQAGYAALAASIVENHLDGVDLNALIKAAIEAGDAEFAANIQDYNDGDKAALCLELASNGRLAAAVEMAEDLDPDSIAALLDIASEQDDWELINKLNDLLD